MKCNRCGCILDMRNLREVIAHEYCAPKKVTDDEPLTSRYYIRLDESGLEVIGNIHDNPELLEVLGDE